MIDSFLDNWSLKIVYNKKSLINFVDFSPENDEKKDSLGFQIGIFQNSINSNFLSK